VTVKRVVGLSLEVELAALEVELAALEVATGALGVVSVESTSVKLSPRGKLNPGMSDSAGMSVTVGSAVGVPVGVVLVVVEEAVTSGRLVVEVVRLRLPRTSDKLSPSGMLICGISEALEVLVIVGRAVGVPVAAAFVVDEVLIDSWLVAVPLSVTATEVLDVGSFPSPLIPPVTPVSSIRARASSWVVHVMAVPRLFTNGREKHCKLFGQGETSQSFSGEHVAKFPAMQPVSPPLQGSWTVTFWNALLSVWASCPLLR